MNKYTIIWSDRYDSSKRGLEVIEAEDVLAAANKFCDDPDHFFDSIEDVIPHAGNV